MSLAVAHRLRELLCSLSTPRRTASNVIVSRCKDVRSLLGRGFLGGSLSWRPPRLHLGISARNVELAEVLRQLINSWLWLLLLHHTNEGLVGLAMELRPLQDLIVGQRDLHLEVVGLIVQKAQIGNLLRLRCL